MKYLLVVFFTLLLCSCSAQDKTSFSQEALADIFLTEEGEEISFSEVLKKYEGKTVLIDVWANWCKDCIIGMPKVKKLQKENPEVVFLFLSLDKTLESWAYGIDKYELEGEHYFVESGWKGPFGSSIDLDWIPRYMVVKPTGEIVLYKAIKADDKKIVESLK